MSRKLSLLVLLFLTLGACASRKYVLQTEVGAEFSSLELMIGGQPLVLAGQDGRLIINGYDHGPLEEGDRLAMDAYGTVYINGKPRYTPGQEQTQIED
jgi:hypothetical protein